jgi:ornithine cyclodeaminase/alanine dehydrogenase-like protein (mu-crystallin family)
MPALLLREDDVRSLVDIQDAIKAVKVAFLEQARGTGHNLARHRVRQPSGTLHLMAAALTLRGYWGFKSYTATKNGVRFSIQLYNIVTGNLLAIIEADHLGQLRTGAASGVATDHLANPQAKIFTIIGAGSQAETQVTAVASVRSLDEIRVFSRSSSNRKAFADRLRQQHGLPAFAAESIHAAVVGAEIVTTITSASSPIIQADWIKPGMHINAAGANAVIRTEIDPLALPKFDFVFTDDLEQARIESGLFTQGFETNQFSWSTLHNLADVVAGIHPGRSSPGNTTLFASHGIALWDIALAADVYERARAANLGEKIVFLE